MKTKKCIAIIMTLISLTLTSASLNSIPAMASQKVNYSIDFEPINYTIKTLTIGDKTIKYRAFENIVYVKNPVDTNYQIMNFYVPEEYYEGKSIGTYTAKNAPIFLPNSVGGYMPGAPGSPGIDERSGSANAAAVALTKGYVVAEPGARGRTTQDANGQYTGKAPACIVDLKAAVRYLHYNDSVMPGNAEKIISNGTSAGGALSALLGATGNNSDYEPYLKELGAANANDDIFAVSSYCPITNLDHADMAYEWLINGINNYKKLKISQDTDFKMVRTFVEGQMTEDEIKLSNELKAAFPEYVNSLDIKNAEGTKLALDENGNGSFKTYVKSLIIESAQKALNSGTDLSEFNWITIKDKTVTDINFDEYIKYLGRMKVTPAFDGVDLSSGENGLFGTSTVDTQHFTEFSKNNDTAGGTIADSNIVKMMNPMNYIGTNETTTAKYWRIRHGAKDNDTAIAISTILAAKLQNNGYNVDYAVPWGQGHGGDYDLNELFDWMDKISKQ